MPLKSKAQEKFLWARHPKIAQEFEEATPENAKLPEHIKHGEEGHLCDGGCVGYAGGGKVMRDPPASYPPPGGYPLKYHPPEAGGGATASTSTMNLPDILAALAALGVAVPAVKVAFGGSKPVSTDLINEVGGNIGSLNTSQNAVGMAQGGMVGEDDDDPAIIPEEIKEFVKKAHKDRQESRPDENWRIKRADKPEAVAPYKRDDEDLKAEAEEKDVPKMAAGGTVPGYDDGGNVQPIDPASIPAAAPFIDPDTLKDLPLDAPMPAVPEAATAAPNVPQGTPPAPAATDADYMAKANKLMGLDSSQQAGLMKLLGDNAKKSQIGAGIAGIGDAIASGGTLGKVNPGNLQRSEEIGQNATKAGIEGMETIRGTQEKAFETAQKLEAQDPNSPLSKYAQKAYGSIGKKLGIDLSHASASLIADVAGKGVEELNTEYQGQLKQMGLQLQKEQVEATKANQEQERRQAATTAQQNAAKDIATRTLGRKMTDTLLPFSATAKADKAINATATGGTPAGPVQVNSQAQYDSLPTGTHYVDSYGTEKVKK